MSRLHPPGGFIPLHALADDREPFDCALCSCAVGLGWLHFASQRAVCGRCLSNPWADGGEAGRRAAERLERQRVGQVAEREHDRGEVPKVQTGIPADDGDADEAPRSPRSRIW